MITTENEVKEKLLQGINMVADAVSPTLGPQAKTAILQGFPPVIINDGVTITMTRMFRWVFKWFRILLLKHRINQVTEQQRRVFLPALYVTVFLPIIVILKTCESFKKNLLISNSLL